MDLLPSAFKHGVARDDIEHAVVHAMAIENLDGDLRLYLGPSRAGALLEVVSLLREHRDRELVIHAMPMRTKYQRLLPGGER